MAANLAQCAFKLCRPADICSYFIPRTSTECNACVWCSVGFRLHPVVLVLLQASPIIFLSFVFWKLDRRNKSLIKHAETTLTTAGATRIQRTTREMLALFTRESY